MSSSEPLGREAHFHRLLEMLNGPASGRWATVETNAFLSRLDLDRPGTESYLLSLVEPLAAMADALQPVGLLPSPLVRLADRLRTARRVHPMLQDLPPLRRTETALRRRAALLYAYAGAVQQALDQLFASPSAPHGVELDLPATTAPRARLRKAHVALPNSDQKRELQWLLDHWEDAASTDPDRRHRTWVPVVERLPSWAQNTHVSGTPTARETVGALRKVVVQLRRAAPAADAADDAPQDQLWADLSPNGDLTPATNAPLAAARALLNREHSALQGRPMRGRLVFDWSDLGHEGQSAGLAIASLFYGAAFDATHQRQRLRVRPTVALTGAIAHEADRPGDDHERDNLRPESFSIRPVSEESIGVKVQTAFFSPKTTLALPKAQTETARYLLDALRDRFPHGRLNVVGVSDLRDVVDHRRLTDRTEIGRVQHVARQLWDRRGAVAGAANPDRTFWAVGLHDITGDGRNEICWAQNDAPSDPPDVVACQAVGAEEPLWEFPLHLSISFPGKPAVAPGEYKAHGLEIGDLNADGRPEVYVSATHRPYFPSVLLQLDAQTGAEIGRYVHPGHLKAGPRAVDLEGDGIQEVLIGGHTNAYHQAAFIVLDPRRVQGHGPATPAYRVAGLPPAAERAYVRIPRTKIGKAQDTYIKVSDITPRSGGRIEVQVEEGTLEANQSRYQPDFRLYFDASLRPRAVGTSSRHDQLADSLAQRGLIESIPDAAYFEEFRARLQYWTGSAWTLEPTETNRWETTVAADTSAR